MPQPLADKLRPANLSEVCGQQHLLGQDMLFRRVIDSGNVPNMIFYGPSGVGKTTVARIVAEQSGMYLQKLNGTSAGIADIKDTIAQTETLHARAGLILYLDEIQYLNKKQQQSLLECIENGTITLIASTTENPYFYVYNALLSRCTVFEFKQLEPADIAKGIDSAIEKINSDTGEDIKIDDDARLLLATSCGGDMRKALGGLEFCTTALRFANSASQGQNTAGADDKTKAAKSTKKSAKGEPSLLITRQMVKQVAQRSSQHYDKSDDAHYDSISALQKSIRGSDADAAVHYLARVLEGGDMLSACRRLLVIAAEDIGLAYPQAIAIVKACVDSALQLGMPEARIPLAEAAILLASAPKSNSAICAIDDAINDLRSGKSGPVPRCLQNKHYDGADRDVKGQNYKYPHAYKNNWVKQQYLPDNLVGTVYYKHSNNKTEQAAKAYWDNIKKDEK